LNTVHECASELTATPQAELFCSCKRRTFASQNKIKVCNFCAKILGF